MAKARGKKGETINQKGKGKSVTFDLSPPSSPLMRSDAALIIFAKAPIPGQVKTRLCPPLTPDEAASLHGSIVLDILERSKTVRGLDRFLGCTPSKEHPFFKTLAARHGVQLWDQVGEDLGRRMDHAFQTAFDKGYRYAILVGTDLPTLPTASFHQAIRLLKEYDMVLGPTLDGGYYLIGLKTPIPELFVDVPWSTDQVFTRSQHKAQSLGLTMGLLENLRDLDTIDDLQAFIDETRGPGKRGFSTRTLRVLQTLASRLPKRMGGPHTYHGHSSL